MTGSPARATQRGEHGRRTAPSPNLLRMNAATLTRCLVTAALASPLLAQQGGEHASKTPPAGPPWVTEFAAARAAALAAHKPIFVYSTKTY